MARPASLIVSCSDKDPKDLVRLIVGHDDLPSPTSLIESIEAYPWHIETKYYTADIHLCTVKNKTIGNIEFAESVQAVVIYFDSKSESSFDKVKEWMTFIKEFAPEVQLLVCENFSDSTSVDRHKVQQWCLKNCFELVELNPEIDENDCDDDFPETVGIKRIIQALHAHLWPNLQMKSKPGFGNFMVNTNSNASDETVSNANIQSSFQELSLTDPQGNENEETSNVAESVASAGNDLSDMIPNDLDINKIFGDEDGASEPSFELLFQRFHQMKEKAQNLPFEERKSYAEKVAVAFWRAIGGDEDEIEGIENE